MASVLFLLYLQDEAGEGMMNIKRKTNPSNE